ncbi:MAG: hypothetical protein HXS54_10445 [Theionarchaea archaeon]|nr:hypothetical protein [Theionarchaea archaeon]
MASQSFRSEKVKLLNRILRKGYYVYEENSNEFQQLQILKDCGFIDYEIVEYYKCYNENDRDYINEHGESCNGELIITEDVAKNGYGYASCERLIYLDDKIEPFRKFKVTIKYKSIAKYLKKTLEDIKVKCDSSEVEEVILCTYENKNFMFAIYEMCTNDFVFANAGLDSPIIYLSIGPLPIDRMDNFNEWKFLTLSQILCDEEKQILKERIVWVTKNLKNTVPSDFGSVLINS